MNHPRINTHVEAWLSETTITAEGLFSFFLTFLVMLWMRFLAMPTSAIIYYKDNIKGIVTSK